MPLSLTLEVLSRAERLQLLRFVTSFAWADLSVSPAERSFVQRLVARLRLDPEEVRQVEEWLRLPPSPDEVDPATVSREHRSLFLDAVRQLAEADATVSPEERESLLLLEQLIR